MSQLDGPSPNEPSREGVPRYLGEVVRPMYQESYDWHAHDYGQVIATTAGSMSVGTPGRVLLLSPAMVLWVPPDVRHWMRYGASTECHYVDVPRHEAERIGMNPKVIAMTRLLGALIGETMPDANARRTRAHTDALHEILRHELVAAPEMPLSITMPRDRRVQSIARAAFSDPSEIESIDTWIAEAPASRKTVERVFAAETGMTPSRWLRHARALHAVARLSAGEKVSVVAADMGYATPSAFSHMFRQTIGCSPSAFRPEAQAV